MILLLGGTAETAPLAMELAEAGYEVLVSMATDVPLTLDAHPRVRRRVGPLDEEKMVAVVRDEAVRLIVDATHPYATGAHRSARAVATRLGIPCVAFVRPSGMMATTTTTTAGAGADPGTVVHAPDHEAAARLAFEVGAPVLLTIGSRHLESYVRIARERRLPLVARVLDHPESLAACERLGIACDAVIVGRGPFSVAQNRELIRRFGIGVLVTKDSGKAGGVDAKLQAAAAEGCGVVVVERPVLDLSPSFGSIAEVVNAAARELRTSVWRTADHSRERARRGR